MARRRKGRDIDGIVLLDKPLGLSSNHALQQVRRLFDAKKAGHTGSLDPLASGLLPICLGEATKISQYLLNADKHYRVTAVYGRATTTGDAEGQVSAESDHPLPDRETIAARLGDFLGPQSQIPPMYSALKHQGRRLYELARAGETVERTPREIVVRALALVDRTSSTFTLDAQVTSGTYIRTLVEDIAVALGGVAHVGVLRRTGVGPWAGADRPMHTFEELERAVAEARLDELRLSTGVALDAWPRVTLDEPRSRAISNGQAVDVRDLLTGRSTERVCVHDVSGALCALGVVGVDGRLSPQRVFARAQH